MAYGHAFARASWLRPFVPPKDWTIRLEDMVEAAEKVARYTRGVPDLDAFASNEMAVDAVIRNVQIIGEAARHIPEEIQARYPGVDWVGMRGMRNFLVHQYGAVRLDVVWHVVQNDIPATLPHLRDILERELPEEASPSE
jgi:uncharacterized protein with HEPN domain